MMPEKKCFPLTEMKLYVIIHRNLLKNISRTDIL